MKTLTPAQLMLAVAALIAVMVILGSLSVKKSLDELEQPALSHRMGIETRLIPMAVTTLKPGMLVRKDDIGMSPWPMHEISDDVLLSDRFIVGRVVQNEIPTATPIRSGALIRTGDYSKEYIGVP